MTINSIKEYFTGLLANDKKDEKKSHWPASTLKKLILIVAHITAITLLTLVFDRPTPKYFLPFFWMDRSIAIIFSVLMFLAVLIIQGGKSGPVLKLVFLGVELIWILSNLPFMVVSFKTDPLYVLIGISIVLIVIGLVIIGKLPTPKPALHIIITIPFGFTYLSMFLMSWMTGDHCEKVLATKGVRPLLTYCEKLSEPKHDIPRHRPKERDIPRRRPKDGSLFYFLENRGSLFSFVEIKGSLFSFVEPKWRSKFEKVLAPFQAGLDQKAKKGFDPSNLSQARIIQVDPKRPDIAYIGFTEHLLPTPLLKFDLVSRQVLGAILVEDNLRFAFDDQRDLLFTTGYTSGKIYVIDRSNFKLLKVLPTGSSPMYVVVEKKYNRLVVCLERDICPIEMFELGNFKSLGRDCPTPPSFGGCAYFPSRSMIACSGPTSSGRRLLFFDIPTRKGEEIYLPEYSVGMAADDEHDRLFISIPFSSELWCRDLKTLKILWKQKLDPFTRDQVYDPARNILYVSSYGIGNVYAIDPDTGKIKGKVFVGRKVRSLTQCRETGKLYLANANGFLEVDPDIVFPH